ncbi:MAG: hypothetical protein L0229_20185 [Blastocatellia bacterium]|nr:hypothetical protein [Blastocatellia bacterium]
MLDLITLTLFFATHTVMIEGRNLRPVYEALLHQKVDFIQEGDLEQSEGDQAETFIFSIEIEESGAA